MFIDAAGLFEPRGTIRVLEPGYPFQLLHTATLLSDHLAHRVKCKGLLIGVQAEVVEFGLLPSAQANEWSLMW